VQHIVSDDGAFVVGTSGFLTDDQMYQTLRVVYMNKQEFTEHRDKEGWSDADDDDDGDDDKNEHQNCSFTQALASFDDIHRLPATWRQLLVRISEHFLSCYQTSSSSSSVTEFGSSQQRQHFSQYVRDGQIAILTRLLQSCSADRTDLNSSAMNL